MTEQYRSYFAFDNPDGGSGGMPFGEMPALIPFLPDHTVECFGEWCIPTVYFDSALIVNTVLLGMKFLDKKQSRKAPDLITVGMLGLEAALLTARSCVFGCDQDQ